jgi:hypothetical protein
VVFNPQSMTGAGTATMTVPVPAATPSRSFSVTVMGTSGDCPLCDRRGQRERDARRRGHVVFAKRAALKAGSWRLVDDALRPAGSDSNIPTRVFRS